MPLQRQVLMLPDKVPGSLEGFRELGSSLLAGAAGDNLSPGVRMTNV